MNELSLDVCAKNLGKHGFEVEIVSSLEEAGNRLREEIEKIHPQTVSYGDSINSAENRYCRGAQTTKGFIVS